ncbi:MAG: hypothetical protein FK733_11000 [Asgard group archaeon]|nr:hypothetical protein [Asgard group archaeon]
MKKSTRNALIICISLLILNIVLFVIFLYTEILTAYIFTIILFPLIICATIFVPIIVDKNTTIPKEQNQ